MVVGQKAHKKRPPGVSGAAADEPKTSERITPPQEQGIKVSLYSTLLRLRKVWKRRNRKYLYGAASRVVWYLPENFIGKEPCNQPRTVFKD